MDIAEDVKAKPDWCPQDVWHNTGMAFDQLYDAEPDLEGGCEVGIRSMAARAILAERERCAKVAEARRSLYSRFTSNGQLVCTEVASAIRSGER